MYKWLILFLTLPFFGAEFRIDLLGSSGLAPKEVSPGAAVTQAGWMGDKKDHRLLVIGEARKDWSEYSATFIAKENGKVSIQLMSNKKNDWSSYRQIRITGATLQNGDFSKLNEKGKPTAWSSMGNPKIEEGFVTTAHNDRWMQSIDCKRGESVTITFQVKAN